MAGKEGDDVMSDDQTYPDPPSPKVRSGVIAIRPAATEGEGAANIALQQAAMATANAMVFAHQVTRLHADTERMLAKLARRKVLAERSVVNRLREMQKAAETVAIIRDQQEGPADD